MKIQIVSGAFDRNQTEELVQRVAWKLVRSAIDRFGDNKGDKKRDWCVSQIHKEFPDMNLEKAEDCVRAAYFNFKIERGAAS